MNGPAAALLVLEALVTAPGAVSLREGGRQIALLQPGVWLKGWHQHAASGGRALAGGRSEGVIRLDGGTEVAVAAVVTGTGPTLELAWDLVPSASLEIESVQASLNLPIADWTGAAWRLEREHGTVPAAFTDGVRLASGSGTRFVLGPSAARHGLTMEGRLAAPAGLLLQDNRRWSPDLEVRAGRLAAGTWAAGERIRVALTLRFNRPVRVVYDHPVTLAAGPDWIPLRSGGTVQPGTALDWSDQAWSRTPAGVQGRVRASRIRPGAFAFERDPGTPVRFYGVNLCFTALFPDHAGADALAERLARQGYNAVRIHHYESMSWADRPGLVDPKAADSLTFHLEALDRLDYLAAALARRGLYLTTDLYVNRAVKAAEIFPGAAGETGYALKHLVHVSDRALANWKEFARRLLTHVNPYTGRAWRDDPALGWISLLNEDNLPNEADALRADPREAALWDAAFARWKARTSATQGWDDEPVRNRFLWETQRDTERKMVAFLRSDLRVTALLTDLNGWTNQYGTQVCRAGLDYVDDHMYWDHPQFLERPWTLPSAMPNGGSAVGDFGGLTGLASSRLLDRPFTVTEYNYCLPNHARGEGGLLMGAFAALQDWGGIWRFAWAHGAAELDGAAPADYFNVASDPLRRLSEYAAVALFLRGDAAVAPAEIAVAAREEDWWREAGRANGGDMARAAWCARVGTLVGEPEMAVNRVTMSLAEGWGPEGLASALRGLRMGGALPAGNRTDPAAGRFESQTGELQLDGPAGEFRVATPRTAGLVAPAGATVTAGPLRVVLRGTGAALWVSSLDGRPLTDSGRMLLVHLTDLANTGARFRGTDLSVLEAAGTLPWLVRAGTADVRLACAAPSRLAVWRLGLDGTRGARVAARTDHGALAFTAATAPASAGGDAVLAYELATR